MNIKYKITAGMATAAMIAGVVVPGAHAANVTIKGNGNNSVNVVGSLKINATQVQQSNATVANTAIVSAVNTGGNKTNKNVGGATTSTTGKATSTVLVSVTGGNNKATLPNCGCPEGNHTVTIQGNGNNSQNYVFGANVNLTSVSQENMTVANTFVTSVANTGSNQTNKNVGGATGSSTGNADSSAGVFVEGGNNVLN